MQSLLPTGCWICRDWQRDAVCAACVARFASARPRCPRCALPLRGPACAACLHAALPLDAVAAAIDYAPPWDALLLQWKHHDALALTAVWAELLQSRIEASDALLLPVPQHPARWRARGYAPPECLAQALGRRLDMPVLATALRRVIETPAQVGLSRAQRLRNLRHAFALPAPSGIAGRACVLVDDVMTTGATLATLADLLRRAGATRVDAWVVARTDAPD